jgi:hypothetical protein
VRPEKFGVFSSFTSPKKALVFKSVLILVFAADIDRIIAGVDGG